VTQTTTRRTYLLAVLRNFGGPVTTKRALDIYAKSGVWADVSRNTARRDLRDLARRAYLVPAEQRGARFYKLSDNPRPAHPTARGSRQFVLEAIRTEGGEWTIGRVRRTWHRLIGTHVLRMTARRYLANLHRDGHLELHGDGTPRRFYTANARTAQGKTS
jgi:predicted ArsR family transcriptional regulator